MYRHFLLANTFLPSLLLLSLVGCGGSQPATSNSVAVAEEAGHEHAHSSEGPHGGSLIELGNEAYHAELVHDDAAGTVTVYVLDSTAKTVVPIEAPDVTINIKHEGRGEQFKLAAAVEQGDATGKSSQFGSSDAELAQELDHEHAEAELVLLIEGKQYRGAIEHHHDHEEHGAGEEHAH